jgi:hypothetical protein
MSAALAVMAHAKWPQVWTAESTAVWGSVGACAVRVILHACVGYARRLPWLFAAEFLLVGIMAALWIPNADASSRVAGWELFGVALAYDGWNVLLLAARHKERVESGTHWLARRQWRGHRLRELAAYGQAPPTRAVSQLLEEASDTKKRLAPRGGTLAGGLIVASLFTTSLAAAGTTTTPTHPVTKVEEPRVSPPPPPEGPPPTDLATYDDICGRTSPHPGDGAPEWATRPLLRLWLGREIGVGANIGGCVQLARTIPNQPEVVYQLGYMHNLLVAVGVCVHYGPTTLYLQSAAARVLRELQHGVVVTGPNQGVITAGKYHRTPTGLLYVTPG